MDKKNRTYIRVAILGVLLAALVFAVYTSFVKDPNAVKVGKEAPNFSLEQLNGPAVTLSDFRGKGVILNFWGTWCEPCKKEMPDLQKQYEAYKDKGLLILGVNIGESPVTVEPFTKQFGITFPILMDKQSEITKLYRIVPIPSTFFIDPDGKVQEIFLGPLNEDMITQKVAKILPK
ncbi:thiol-disulfide oxidoreductase ResA [Brevibacillus borstelensis]|uniref:thiol-disulfide oxidoreductase ResA n=1 Tax=Brevibacillus borstelensis TaxID=45462 RepID=UPI001D0A838A|nr:thiol-disulfide oxidoreductase ResA [Brevibacillus borstelensis]MCC0562678.1 thiol-disulfide oxidoreductase ResA [Brevibacillus borstelensis]MCM3589440.1 thiol-disulfide oxidoreductase ResA [Brevibacillus borstelensis]MED1851092.1 thiol-disulfide oxidoreductase ResA [Brevibacillus borstelensis]WNF03728.1 thiol-disulfide oxidoreductase ResA [Brevibacillus borstelensis]